MHSVSESITCCTVLIRQELRKIAVELRDSAGNGVPCGETCGGKRPTQPAATNAQEGPRSAGTQECTKSCQALRTQTIRETPIAKVLHLPIHRLQWAKINRCPRVDIQYRTISWRSASNSSLVKSIASHRYRNSYGKLQSQRDCWWCAWGLVSAHESCPR